MKANVRCAGGGQWYETWEDAEIDTRNIPCGWTGPFDSTEFLKFYERQEDIPSLLAQREVACPNCGGRVELIPADGDA